MNKLAKTSAILILCIPGAAIAEPASSKNCVFMGEVASIIMTARQKNLPMSEVMKAMDKFSADVAPLARDMVIAAYEEPSYSTDQVKSKQLADFSNAAQLQCYKAGGH